MVHLEGLLEMQTCQTKFSSIPSMSGLDSFSAVQLCQVLKKVANAGASVLFTIHQPASEIFNSFDHLILLRPEADMMLVGKGKQAWQDMEKKGRHVSVLS